MASPAPVAVDSPLSASIAGLIAWGTSSYGISECRHIASIRLEWCLLPPWERDNGCHPYTVAVYPLYPPYFQSAQVQYGVFFTIIEPPYNSTKNELITLNICIIKMIIRRINTNLIINRIGNIR